MNMRMVRRAVTLGYVLATCVVHFWLMRLKGPRTFEQRALWLQNTCTRILRSLGIRVEVEGAVPARGLVVANHLSYLDIVILSAAMPCFFVAKTEIDAWPYFGRAARAGGTIFIDRSSRASAEQVADEIAERLALPVPILFFPEGTSTDGMMLPFHPRLFEPAIRSGAPVTAASVQYVINDGTPERELCWFGDDAFAPHLLKTLKTPGFHARLRFGPPRTYPNRRVAAEETFAEIAALRAGAPMESLLTV
jgi:1-acyl-sn-glycerol-3-phosphate acyltransferase